MDELWEKIELKLKEEMLTSRATIGKEFNQPVPKLQEFKSNSPHKVVLVLIPSQKTYEKFLAQHNLSRQVYKYLHHIQQLVGYDWDSAYLLRVGMWGESPLFDELGAHQILDCRFPGWNDEENLPYY